MKNKFLVLLIALFTVFSTINFTFADLKVSESTGTSIKFSWDKESKANYYQIFYGEQSSESGKQTGETEATESTNFEIKGLKENTKYYFTLVGLDSSGVEVYKSSEKEFTTSSSSSTFSIVESKLIDNQKLVITFSKNLDLTKLDKTELKIENSSNPSETISVRDVTEVSSDSKSIEVDLDTAPTSGEEYKVIVLVVYDEAGNNIKFGVDSESTFTGGDIKNSDEISLDNIAQTDNTELPLNAAGPEEEKAPLASDRKVLTGISGTAEHVGKNVDNLSENKEKLPQTGPEMIVLLLLALAASGAIVFFKNKKA